MAKTTLTQVRDAIRADTTSVKHGIFTVRKGFFYTGGYTASRFEAAVKASFPTAVIVDSGEVWKSFRGGASVAQSSHWFVKFSVPEAA